MTEYKNIAPNRDYAVSMAEMVLGKRIGGSSDGITHVFNKSGPMTFKWLEKPGYVGCEGLPTTTLPGTFIFRSNK